MRRPAALIMLLVMGLPAAACAPGSDTQRHPDVVDVTVERTGDTYTFTVTISSP